MNARVYAVVTIGGCAGGATRLAIDVPVHTAHWAWDIMAINVVGAGLLGALTAWASLHRAPWWLPALGPGFLGGFTTFSAMASPHPQSQWQAPVALVMTLVTASLAAAGGWGIGHRLWAATDPPLNPDDAEARVEGFESDTSERPS